MELTKLLVASGLPEAAVAHAHHGSQQGVHSPVLELLRGGWGLHIAASVISAVC